MMMMDVEQASVMAASELNGGCHGGPFVPDRQQKEVEGRGRGRGGLGRCSSGGGLEPGEEGRCVSVEGG